MLLMREVFRCLWLAPAFILFTAASCHEPKMDIDQSWEHLLSVCEEDAARQWFLAIIRSNGIEEAFQAALSRPPVGRREWEVDTVRCVPGTNGLVYVRVRPDPEYIPGQEAELKDWGFEPERFWFFFDRSGNLLKWSGNSAGTWLIIDVTGDGVKDLLVSSSSPRGLEGPQGGDGRTYYTLFQTSTSPATVVPFGASAIEGVTYECTPIYLPRHSTPLVMTYEEGMPVANWATGRGNWGSLMPSPPASPKSNQDKQGEWYGTVIRSFNRGEPRTILAVPDRLTLCTSPGGEVMLEPECEDAGYIVRYSPLKRRFELEWAEKQPRAHLRAFSATVPE